MGNSAEAILVFGIPFDDESQYPEFMEGFGDWEEYCYALLGIPEYGHPDRSEYKEIQKLVDTLPVDLVHHCTHDTAMYILAVRGAKFTADWGDPHVFEDGIPDVSEEKIGVFHAWAAERGVEGKARWVLCSMWG